LQRFVNLFLRYLAYKMITRRHTERHTDTTEYTISRTASARNVLEHELA